MNANYFYTHKAQSMARWETHRTDANAADLYHYAKSLGLSVTLINRPVDAIVGAFGLTVAVEVKTTKGKLRAGQSDFMRDFRGATAVWRDKADVERTLAYCETGKWMK